MPQTKFQDFIYTVIMVPVMVYAMVCYNIALDRGALSNFVFRAALSELPLMCLIAFVLEFFLIGRVAQKLAFRLVRPERDAPVLITTTISGVIVCLMCPIMSLVASLLFNFSSWSEAFARWVQIWFCNFPMALLYQLFFAGPLVRFISVNCSKSSWRGRTKRQNKKEPQCVCIAVLLFLRFIFLPWRRAFCFLWCAARS